MLFSRLNRRYCIAGALFLWCIQGLFAQNNNDIYFKYCEVRPRPACFDPVAGSVDSVGRDVKELGGNYQFCFAIDSVNAGFAPIRVVLLLDRSGSMCDQNAGACCTEGDGSGLCMYNDPTDQRVEAAHLFVDSLRAKNKKSEVGVVIFWEGVRTQSVLSLDSDANVAQLHEWINDASCSSSSLGISGTRTNIGAALEAGIGLADAGVDPSMARHIILLTDGAWDDVTTRGTPQAVINEYTTDNPGKSFPIVHGVFLSDSALHVLHDYPPEGCSSTRNVELEHLQSITTLTGGRYIPRASPQTIVANFSDLLNTVVVRVEKTLKAMAVANLTNGETREGASITPVAGGVANQTQYQATINNLPLVDGVNTIVVTQTVANPATNVDEIYADTVTIFRTTEWTSTIDPREYLEYCVLDSTKISITVTPEEALVNSPFTVNSTVLLKENFILNDVEVRVFTRFPDTDPASVSVFHFENNLENSINTTNSGTGTVEYSSTSALFDDYCISKGSFRAPVGNLNGDFTLEAWVRPASGGAPAEIFNGSGNVLGIDAEGFLTFSANGTDVAKSTIKLDANTWSHIGALKTNNTITLFINGVNCTPPLAFTGTFSGAMTIACPAGGLLDEVRVSNVSRLRAGAPGLRLDIPAVPNITWTLPDGSSAAAQPYIVLTSKDWTAGGTTQFGFSSPVSGDIVVNFQHMGTPEAQWGKNGNRVTVLVDTIGPYITRAIFTRGPLSGTDVDTLQVFFSEPVLCSSLKNNSPYSSFRIYKGPVVKDHIFGGSYFADTTCPSEYITQTTVMVKSMEDGIQPKVDSILLIGTVEDTAGNYPDTTKKGPIEWGKGTGIVIAAIPNTASEQDPMAIDPFLAEKLYLPSRQGRVIQLQAGHGALLEMGKDVDGRPKYGDAIIFDAVGNIVGENLPVKRILTDDRNYFIYWNGANRAGRKVATGGYLLRVLVRYENEPEKQVRLQTKFSLKRMPGAM
jgi:hypothetical protein